MKALATVLAIVGVGIAIAIYLVSPLIGCAVFLGIVAGVSLANIVARTNVTEYPDHD